MSTHTVDVSMARRMIEASAISTASIIGQPGGWSVMLKIGKMHKPLGTQRNDKPRLWCSLDRCIDYLKTELKIAKFDMLDATNHSATGVDGRTKRADTSDRMRRAHAASVHDEWFRAEVDQAVIEADAPDAAWVSNEAVMAQSAKQREIWLNRIVV